MLHPVSKHRDGRALRLLHHQCGFAWRKFCVECPSLVDDLSKDMPSLFKSIKVLERGMNAPRVKWPKWEVFQSKSCDSVAEVRTDKIDIEAIHSVNQSKSCDSLAEIRGHKVDMTDVVTTLI